MLDRTDWTWRHARDSRLARHVGAAVAHPYTYTLLTTSHKFVTQGGAVWADFDVFDTADRFYSAVDAPDVLNARARAQAQAS